MKRGKNKELFNKSSLLVLTVIIIAIIFLLLVIKNFVLTSKVIEKPPVVSNCSNESIKSAWEAIFKGSSEGLIILSPNETSINEVAYSNSEDLEFGKDVFLLGGCPLYSIYQINGSNVKMISGWGNFFGMKMIAATSGNFAPEFVEFVLNMSQTQSLENIQSTEILYLLRNSSIGTIEEAKIHFDSIFNVSSSNWTSEESSSSITLQNGTTQIIPIISYSFEESETAENINLFGESINTSSIRLKVGQVEGNFSYEYYTYAEDSTLSVFEYLEKKFENWTSPINTSLNNITIYVNGSKLEILEDYEETQRLEIQQNNQKVIETELNFTDNFDFTKIVLKKQENNSETGYLIINGLNSLKNITIDKLNSESDTVCIKDKEINNINEISLNCDSTDEYLLECPGSIGNFTCNISGNKFIITGLTHSAVIEVIPEEEEPCLPNWQCEEWSDYEDNCGYRICTDINECNNITNMPIEQKECPVCIENWNCTKFLPEKCPKEEVRERFCTDLNDCGTFKDKPDLEQNCERDTNWMWILIGVIIAIIIFIIILIIARGNKRQPQNSNSKQQVNPKYPPNNQQPEYLQENNNAQNLEQGYNNNQIFVPRTALPNYSN